jgi:hypothetical protein
MRYIDSGSRESAQSAGAWLENELNASVIELRLQTGYFSADALGPFAPTLQRLADRNQTTRILIGSNAGETVREDVLRLIELLGVPRPNADIGLVNYGNALYHPKTYHLRRKDGSQCAYVGSANLTSSGLSSLNVEAGILLDTRHGDSGAVLRQIAAAIDDWFTTNRAGLCRVADAASVHQLVADGVLAEVPPPRATTAPGPVAGGCAAARPKLRPLIALPPLAPSPAGGATPATTPTRPVASQSTASAEIVRELRELGVSNALRVFGQECKRAKVKLRLAAGTGFLLAIGFSQDSIKSGTVKAQMRFGFTGFYSNRFLPDGSNMRIPSLDVSKAARQFVQTFIARCEE